MSTAAPSTTRCISLQAALIANALALAVIGGVGAILILAFRQTAWAIVWLVLGLIADEILLYWILRQRRPVPDHLESLTHSLLTTLDAQAHALSEQQRQIAGLQAALTDQRVRQHISGTLSQQATPKLAALVDGLEQTEASLPDMLPQTRAWVAEIRRLAAHAQAHVQALSDEVAWR